MVTSLYHDRFRTRLLLAGHFIQVTYARVSCSLTNTTERRDAGYNIEQTHLRVSRRTNSLSLLSYHAGLSCRFRVPKGFEAEILDHSCFLVCAFRPSSLAPRLCSRSSQPQASSQRRPCLYETRLCRSPRTYPSHRPPLPSPAQLPSSTATIRPPRLIALRQHLSPALSPSPPPPLHSRPPRPRTHLQAHGKQQHPAGYPVYRPTSPTCSSRPSSRRACQNYHPPPPPLLARA